MEFGFRQAGFCKGQDAIPQSLDSDGPAIQTEQPLSAFRWNGVLQYRRVSRVWEIMTCWKSLGGTGQLGHGKATSNGALAIGFDLPWQMKGTGPQLIQKHC
jgi:hypothetical protein